MNNSQLNFLSESTISKSRDYRSIASIKSQKRTVEALKKNNFTPMQVNSKKEALEKIKELIPAGVSIMNGTSATLQQIGFIDLLKSKDIKWHNLHEAILVESDPQKQSDLRRRSVISDYYIGSAHAITETGEILIASNSGSQLPHLVYTSPNIVLVVGAQKIMPTLTEAYTRLKSYVVNLEENRMKETYGFGTTHAKTVILHKENPMMGRKIHVIIVNEELGF